MATLKPTTHLRPKNAPKTPVSHPRRRHRFQPHTGTSSQRRQGFQRTEPPGLRGLAAVPVGGGRARAATHERQARPIGGRRGACGAWPGFETTRRAKLAARTARGRAGHAAAGNQAERSNAEHPAEQSNAEHPAGRSNTGDQANRRHGHTQRPGQAGSKARRRHKHRRRKRKAYSPRNALIAGISRTAWTRPAR